MVTVRSRASLLCLRWSAHHWSWPRRIRRSTGESCRSASCLDRSDQLSPLSLALAAVVLPDHLAQRRTQFSRGLGSALGFVAPVGADLSPQRIAPLQFRAVGGTKTDVWIGLHRFDRH